MMLYNVKTLKKALENIPEEAGVYVCSEDLDLEYCKEHLKPDIISDLESCKLIHEIRYTTDKRVPKYGPDWPSHDWLNEPPEDLSTITAILISD